VKLIHLEQDKLSAEYYTEFSKQMEKQIREESEKRKKLRRNLLTLENYTERYTPLVVLQTIREMMEGVFQDE